MITAKMDQRALDRYLKTLDKNRGKPLKDRAQRTTNAAARRYLVPALKAAAPKGAARRRVSSGPIAILNRKRRRRMSTSAGAKLLRQRPGEDIRPTWAGYRAFHARFVLEGTDTHNLGRNVVAGARGRWVKGRKVATWRSNFASFAENEVVPLGSITVRGVTPNPVVDRVWAAEQGGVLAQIKRDVFVVK